MDSLVSAALEEICSRAASGIHLPDLFTSLSSTGSTLGLPLDPNIKQTLWARLVTIPVIKFELHGSAIDVSERSVQSAEEAERIGVKLIAEDCMRDSFLGIYDLKAASGDMSKVQRDTLEMLAAARSDGITQNELCKRTGKKGNDFFYVVKSLASHGLIVRQSTMIREKEQGEASRSTPSIINTNLLHLYRYGKKMNTNSQQRVEIVKRDLLENEGGIGNNNSNSEDVCVKDYLPAMKAICDKLEEAEGKVLVVSDIKPALGYRLSKGHRAWRNVLNRLKDANLVEELKAKINGKVVVCVKLLRSFSPAEFQPKTVSNGYNNNNNNNNKLSYEELSKRGKRGYVTEQYVELPLDDRIYDLVESEGSKGITINEVGGKLGINPKKLSTRVALLRERFNMVCQDETINRTSQYRFWTRKNYYLHKSNSGSENPGFQFPDKGDNNNINNNSLSIVESSQNNSESNNNNWVENISENNLAIVQVEEEKNVPLSEGPLCNIVKSGGRKRIKDWRYPRTLTVSSGATREEKILEKLKKERFVLAVELYKWLESSEKDKNTKMDRKTLIRSLNKLQQEGKCKNIKVSIPGLTNCTKSRLTDVILHPTDLLSQDLLDEIQERHRKFEFENRRGGIAKSKQTDSDSPVTVLPPNLTKPSIKSKEETNLLLRKMRSNGYLLAKMVRAKLLHKFLWNYVSNLPGWNNNKFDSDEAGPTYQLFEKEQAIKEMPLELFLQVVGYAGKIDDMVERCKNGVRLFELTLKEYESLMDNYANVRLSRIIDVLVRLKLIRLVRVQSPNDADVGTTSAAVLEHALELRPYIEAPGSGSAGPAMRHDFVLSRAETVDAYWENLEYCYATASCHDGSLAFPASSVPEVASRRAWTWTWIMTLDQRTELFKRLSNFGLEKIPFKECVTFARELNLSVEQVLRVSRERRQSLLISSKSDKAGRRSSESVARAFSKKRKRPQESQHDGQQLEEEGNDFASQFGLLKRKRVVSKRFTWTDFSDRLLIMQYVRRRVYLGPNIHRVDWSSISNLPALPATCRRRMAILKLNLNIRRALSRLCNLLSERYAKCKETTATQGYSETEEFCWDNFEDPEVKKAFEEVLEYKRTAKLEYPKRDRSKSASSASRGNKKDKEPKQSDNADVAAPPKRDRETERLRKRFPNILHSKGEMVKRTVCASLAAANAVELLKLAGLSASESARGSLERTLRMYTEGDLSVAFSYLKEKNYMVAGQGSQPYVLSGKFFHDLYSSPFPVGTGKRASQFATWLNNQEQETLIREGVSLSSDPQCGETVHLLSLVSNGEFNLSPLLPEQGIGESVKPRRSKKVNDDVSGDVSGATRKRRSDESELEEGSTSVKKVKKVRNSDGMLNSRKVKGFPGIRVTVTRQKNPRDYRVSATSALENRDESSVPLISINGELSSWDKMREFCYAVWTAEISCDTFRSVCSVINRAGEEGVSMEQISDVLDPQGLGNSAELIVGTLEKFGFAIKVNGYDSVRVLNSTYRSKYHINSQTSFSSSNALSLIKRSTNNETLNPVSVPGPTLSLCEGHKVTIINNTSQRAGNEEREDEERERERFCVSNVSRPILPWINADGSLNSTVFEALTRRVLGTVMQKPGILEEDIIHRMDVLNPQSCRRLLETLVLDKDLIVRTIYQEKSGPPSILQALFSSSTFAPVSVCRKHFFANPHSSTVLL
ncbi:hypothetical protein LUZ60_016535 [Juncus effusus]|nr:hypothetical protein LUZ60_016535 [Juncus effusus]